MSEYRIRNKFLFCAGLISMILFQSGRRNASAQQSFFGKGGKPVSYEQQAVQHKPADKESYRSTWQKIWQAVQKGFYDTKMNGVDWKKIGDTYEARLAGITSRSEFETLMNQMLAELHASHMAYVTTDDAEYYMMQSVSMQDMQHDEVEHIGIMGRQEGKEYVVSAVLDGYPAQQAGIATGDRIQSADGKPFTTAEAFRGKAGSPVTIQFKRDGEEKPRAVAVKPVKSNMLRAFLEATKRSAKILDVSGKKIGYIHLWTMATESFRATLESQILTKLHDTDGLVLDLRDGYGGHPFGFSDVFFRPDISWESERQNSKPSLQHTGYNKPIVVLINEGTRSAKEFFAYQMKSTKRATLVGTRTAGAFIGAYFVKIGEAGLLELAGLGLKVDGMRLENQGVTPDIMVVGAGSYSEKDTQLDQAKKTLVALALQNERNSGKADAIHAN